MKKLIILFAAVFSIVFTGCEIDNFEAPEAMLSGTVMYNGNAVGVRTNGPQLELWQDGYALKEKIAVHIAQDGTYSAHLFSGVYKMVRLDGAPWDAQSGDTITINVSGNTVKNIEVQPYFTISDESFEVKGNAVVAEFVVNQIDPEAALKDVKLYLNNSILVDENQTDFSKSADVTTIVSGEKVTMIATLPQILDSEFYYFARVGVRSDQSNEFYYTQVQKLEGDPTGPKNPTVDFTSVVNGRDVTFTSTSKYVESFMWDFGDGETSTDENPTHTYTQGGEYTITLTATGAEGTITAVVTHSINVGFVAVPVLNSNFSLPGTTKQTNWTNVPGWNSDTESSDSGVEGGGTNWTAFIKNSDPAVYNLTDHTIQASEEFKITLYAWDIWNGPHFIVRLYYDNGDGVRNVLKSQTFDITAGQTLAVEMTAIATSASVGAKLGIEIDNTSGDGGDGWTGFDDVQLFAK